MHHVVERPSLEAAARGKTVPRGWLWGLVAVATAIRFIALGRQSFWYDEAVSVEMARHSLGDLLSGRVKDLGNPPLYPALLHIWTTLFGEGDRLARALSAVLGVATVPLVYAVGRRALSARVAFVGAVIFALAPFQVQMAQEARTFTFLTFAGTAATAALLRALERPERWGAWILFSVATGAMVLLHYFGFFLALTHAGYIAVRYRRDRGVLLRALAAFALAAALFGFWIPSFLGQLGVKGNLARSAESWHLHLFATPLVFGEGTTLVWKEWSGKPRLGAGLLAMAVLGGSLLLGLWRSRSKPGFGLLACWLVLPILLPALVSVLASPLYNTRYVIAASVPFYLFVAAGLCSLPRAWAVTSAGALLLTMGISHATYFTKPVKHQWRETVQQIEGARQPDDVLVFDADYNETAYAHYAPQVAGDVRVRLLAPPPGTPEGHLFGVSQTHATASDVTPSIEAHRRAWLVLADARPDAMEHARRAFTAWSRKAQVVLRGITFELYEHAPRVP